MEWNNQVMSSPTERVVYMSIYIHVVSNLLALFLGDCCIPKNRLALIGGWCRMGSIGLLHGLICLEGTLESSHHPFFETKTERFHKISPWVFPSSNQGLKMWHLEAIEHEWTWCIPPHGPFWRDNDDSPVDWVMHHFQTNPNDKNEKGQQPNIAFSSWKN